MKKAESGNIERFFADVNREYESLIDRSNDIPADERRQRLDAVSKRLRDCVLSDILERRTRTDVEKYYKDDMESQGLIFPKIVGPNNLEYIMDDELAQLFSDTMTIIAPTEAEKLQTDEWLNISAIVPLNILLTLPTKENILVEAIVVSTTLPSSLQSSCRFFL